MLDQPDVDGDSPWDPASSLRAHLEALVGERSPEAAPERLRRVETYVEASFREAGLLTLRERIRAAPGPWHNVLGDLPAGGEPPPPLFIVGAHMDAVEGSPGADDNASGLAVLLALAGRFGRKPPPRGRASLRFAAFNLEEWGMVGSQEHAEALRAAGRSVVGMISLEMVGYADPARGSQRYPPGMGFGRSKRGDFISVVGDRRSRGLVAAATAALRAEKGLPVESAVLPAPAALLIGAALSDHAPFWRLEIPAVMVGDTAFYRNPHYHRPTDTLESLSLPFMSRVARGLARLLEQTARGTGRLRF